MEELLLVCWLIIFCYLLRKKYIKLFGEKVDEILGYCNETINDEHLLRSEAKYHDVTEKIESIDKYTISDAMYDELQVVLKELNESFEILVSIHTSVTAIYDCYEQAEDKADKEYWKQNLIREVTTYKELLKKFEVCHLILEVRYNEIYRL